MSVVAKIKKNKIITSTIVGAVIVSLILSYFIFFKPQTAEAEWFNDQWFYRKKVEITNAGTAQTDFQVAITLDTAALYTAGKIQSDCDDIRITDITGKLLPHWIEENNPGCNNAATKIWVKVPSIPTSGQTAYVYYGNPNAVSVENGDNVFQFFDNFNGSALGASKWNTYGDSITVEGGYVKLGQSGSQANEILSLSYQVNDGILEYRSKTAATSGEGEAVSFARSSVNSGDAWTTSGTQGFHPFTVGNGTEHAIYIAAVLGANTANTLAYNTFKNFRVTLSGVNLTFKKFADNWASEEASVSYTDTGGRTSGYIGLRGHSSRQHWCDWFLVRKYAATEPTVGSPGTEQQGPGPVAYWRFDEGTGDTTYDDSTNNNDGTRGGGTADYKPTWQAEDMCVSGKCLRYDGTDDYVNAGNAASLNITDAITIEAWVKYVAGNEGYIVAKDSCGDVNIWSMRVTNANIFQMRVRNSAGTNFYANSPTITPNEWHHMVAVKDATELKVYADGIVGTPTAFSGTLNTNAFNVWIGDRTNPGCRTPFNGLIDDVRIYNYARSAAQIKTDYLAGMRGGGEAAVTLGAANQKYLSDGLVGYWKMDESSWTNDCSASTVTDSSGAGNNGKSCPAGTGPTGGAAGKFGNAGSFDGTNDCVVATDSTSLDIGTNDFTIAAWVKRDVVSAWHIIMRKDDAGQTTGYEFYISSSNTLLLYITSNAFASSGTITDSNWHFVAVGADRDGNAVFYIDGSNAGSTNISGTTGDISNAYNLGIGSNGTCGGDYFDGTLDEVRIYNRALSPKEVRDLYNWAPGPVGHWKMDEKVSGNSQTIYDSSTYGNNGTTYWGANASGMDCANLGKYGAACQFDGTDDYVDAGNGTSLNITNAITIETWEKPLVDGSDIVSVAKDNVTVRAWEHWKGGDNYWYFAIWDSSGTSHTTTSNNTNSADNWDHIAVTYDGSVQKLYINGVLQTDIETWTGTVKISPANVRIGSRSDGALFFNGLIDDVRIYNYARTQKQILEDMNAGHPAVGSPVGSYAAYWKFDEGYSNIAYDMSGNNNDGTLTPGAGGGNTQAYQMWDNAGKFGKAIEFDGTDDYVDVGTPASLDFGWTNSFSIGLWVKTSQASGSYRYLVGRTTSSAGYTFQIHSTKARLWLVKTWIDDAIIVESTNAVNDGNWHHLVATYNGSGTASGAKVYVDSIDKSTTITNGLTGDFKQTSENVKMGYDVGWNYYDGLIDEVKIYPFALTEDEIKTEYNKGAAIKFGSVSTASDGSTASDAASRGYCVPGDTSTCSVPVGEWKFDEKTGSSANDTSGNGYTGTLNGDTTWKSASECKSGSCLYFDGTGDYISLGAAKFDSLTNATIEFWFYYTGSFDSNRVIFSRYKDDSNRMPIFVSSSNQKIAYENIVGGVNRDIVSDSVVSASAWYHAAFTCGTGGMKMYVNGKLQTDTDATTDCFSAIAATARNDIGTEVLTNYFPGKIDQAVIYDYIRTPAQIAWDYNRGKPVAWWKFDECQGGTVYDMSDNNNDGAITIGGGGTQDGIGTCTDGDTTNAWYNGRTGKYNSSLNFDGTDDYVAIPSSDSLNPLYELTLEAWIRPSDLTAATWHHILAKSDGYSGNPYMLGTYGIELAIQIDPDNAEADTYTAGTLSTGVWQHVAGVFSVSEGKLKLYINGVEYSRTTTATNAGEFTDRYLNIGRRGDTGYFNGLIDDVKIYNYALTVDQIQTAYNQGAAVRFGPSTGSP